MDERWKVVLFILVLLQIWIDKFKESVWVNVDSSLRLITLQIWDPKRRWEVTWISYEWVLNLVFTLIYDSSHSIERFCYSFDLNCLCRSHKSVTSIFVLVCDNKIEDQKIKIWFCSCWINDWFPLRQATLDQSWILFILLLNMFNLKIIRFLNADNIDELQVLSLSFIFLIRWDIERKHEPKLLCFGVICLHFI